MKVSVNLASQPYENLRPFYLAAGTGIVLLIALSLIVVLNARQNRNENSMLTKQSNRFEKDLQNLDRERRELEQWLARPEVQEIRDRSAFLNSIIMRKSISWTQLFMDLEQILPERVQINSIRQRQNESQDAELSMTVSSPGVPPLVEFLKDLELSAQFGTPAVESERYPPEKAADPNITLEMSVRYHQTAGPQGTVPRENPHEPSQESAGPQAGAITPHLPPQSLPAARTDVAVPGPASGARTDAEPQQRIPAGFVPPPRPAQPAAAASPEPPQQGSRYAISPIPPKGDK